MPTPVLGIHQECAYANAVFDYAGCWTGVIDDVYVFVEIGALWSDPEQGALRVYTSTLDLQEQGAESVYRSPMKAGKLQLADVRAPRVLVQTNDGAQQVFNLATRQWEGSTAVPAACTVYPLALHHSTVTNARVGQTLPDILNGSKPGNFGWLSWTGNQRMDEFVSSLTSPDTSQTYRNPHDSTDQTLSVGNWVHRRPGIANSRPLRQALDALIGQTIIVPVWDQVAGKGQNLDYAVSGFAQIQITSYRLPGEQRLSARYLGPIACT